MTTAVTQDRAPSAAGSAGGLHEAGGGRYRLEGAVTMANVADLRSDGVRAFAHGQGAIEVDLSGVGRADSAALALLIDWLAWARGAQRVLKYSAPPPALLALAHLSDVEDLLLGTESTSRATSA